MTDPIAVPDPDRVNDCSASDTVVAGIMTGLETRRLVPGQRLVEADLMVSFGVSRNSVREALHRLASDGVVNLLRHKGAAIRVLTLKETLDVLEVAERISGLMARSAARAVARDADATGLAESIKRLNTADAAGDRQAFSSARRDYYRAMLALGQNQELSRLISAIHMPIVYAQHRLPRLQQIRLQDYRVIAREVLSGNEDAADLAAMVHVSNVRDEIVANTP